MTGPNSAIDPAFAVALDRFNVPPASAAFGDAIVAAALSAKRPARPGWRSRERHRPWTRRALAGGVALALCTTAVAAALLDHVGIRLPAIPAFLAPTPIPTTPHIAMRKPAHSPKAEPKRHAPSVTASEPRANTVLEVAAAPVPLSRREVIRERLSALAPSERREVVRQVIRRAIIGRAIANRVTGDGRQRRAVLSAATQLAPRLAERPALRAALIERSRMLRVRRDRPAVVIPNVVADAHVSPPMVVRPLEPLQSLVRPDASVGAVTPVLTSRVSRAERAERLGQLRQMRALRRQRRP